MAQAKKEYIVRFGGVGGVMKGERVATDNPKYAEWEWEWLLSSGAISAPTAEEDAALTPAEQIGKTKEAAVGADASELATGQPGGSPLPSSLPDDGPANGGETPAQARMRNAREAQAAQRAAAQGT